MIETLSKQIFDYLTSDYEYHNIQELSDILTVDKPNILDEISKLNKTIIKNGAEIYINNNEDFKFIIYDDKKFRKFLRNDWYKLAYISQESSDKYSRYKIILRLLLFSNNYIKQQELSDMLYVSKSQINKDMIEIKEHLDNYNLSILSKPYYGMKISGREKDIRMAIKDEIGEDDILFNNNQEKKLFKKIEATITNLDFGDDYYLSHINQQNLIIHLFILIIRISNNKVIVLPQDIEEKVITFKEAKIAEKIINELQENLDIEIPYQEFLYLTMHLIAKNSVVKQDKISQEILSLTDDIIKEIYRVTNYDFRDNIDLYFSLSTHLAILSYRIKYGFNLKNPIINDIKNHPLSFQIATIGSRIINNKYHVKISEDEIGYIALHIMAAMENPNKSNKKNILVICGSGKSSAMIMKSQLENQFKNQIDKIETTDLHNIKDINLEEFDFIVSSLNIILDTKIPIIYADIIFKDKDVKSISSAINYHAINKMNKIFKNSIYLKHLKVKTKNEILKSLSLEASKYINLEKEYIYTQFQNRERLGNTSFSNGVAIPHILEPVNTDTFMIISSLDKPIIWDNNKVKIIISLFIGKDNGDMTLFYDKLGNYLNNIEAINNSANFREIEEFLELFLNL
ncbi:BglG family transcription antiterminator [Helcococcus kunzii]|uniref:BglG family transcription antiterminator n=1 Tax=Helcococcus kunzii TaxID=40091 RepID=UPI0024ACB4F8|nr:BglG family transcription antiterminator [Helcococcus kunzii]